MRDQVKNTLTWPLVVMRVCVKFIAWTLIGEACEEEKSLYRDIPRRL